MMPVLVRALGALIVCTSILPALVRGQDRPVAEQTALDRYVAAPDPTYAYKLHATLPADGVTASVLRLTSQTWLTEKEVDHPVWEHWLTVIRPA